MRQTANNAGTHSDRRARACACRRAAGRMPLLRLPLSLPPRHQVRQARKIEAAGLVRCWQRGRSRGTKRCVGGLSMPLKSDAAIALCALLAIMMADSAERMRAERSLEIARRSSATAGQSEATAVVDEPGRGGMEAVCPRDCEKRARLLGIQSRFQSIAAARRRSTAGVGQRPVSCRKKSRYHARRQARDSCPGGVTVAAHDKPPRPSWPGRAGAPSAKSSASMVTRG